MSSRVCGICSLASITELHFLSLPSGVIFFGENIEGADLAASISQLNLANSKGPNPKQPLLLMTDQEGGQIRRLPGAPVNVSFTLIFAFKVDLS